MDIYNLKNIYNSREAVQESLRQYWELDRLCEFSTIGDGSRADIIVMFTDLKMAIKSVKQPNRDLMFYNYCLGYPESFIVENTGWTNRFVNSLINEGIDKVYTALNVRLNAD